MITKIFITDTSTIGRRCKQWAKENLSPEFDIVESMENCDIFISIFYNKLISKKFIEARKKCLNFHGGILPEYRGSGTINFAIINGEKETGITLHEIDEKIDHGPIIDIQKIPIEENDTAQTLYEKLENVIFEMFKKWFYQIAKLDYTALPQDHSKATIYSRNDLQKTKNLTKFLKAFTFYDKEKAFYINAKGEKIYPEY